MHRAKDQKREKKIPKPVSILIAGDAVAGCVFLSFRHQLEWPRVQRSMETSALEVTGCLLSSRETTDRLFPRPTLIGVY